MEMHGQILLLLVFFSFGGVVVGGQCVSSCGRGGAPIGDALSSLYCCQELRGGGYRTPSGTCIPCHDESSHLLPYSDSDDLWVFTGGSGDDCGVGYGGACSQFASCELVEEGLRCVCRPGFSGNGLECTDIDECEAGSDSCDRRLYISAARSGPLLNTRGLCRNTRGGFTCSCRKGFTLVGSKCIDKDECVSGGRKCAKNAVCQNVVGSYQCHCPAGYEGNGVNCCLSLKHIQDQELSSRRERKRGSRRSKGRSRKRCSRSRSSTKSSTKSSSVSGSVLTSSSSQQSPRPSLTRPASDTTTSSSSSSSTISTRISTSKSHLTRGCRRYLKLRNRSTSGGARTLRSHNHRHKY